MHHIPSADGTSVLECGWSLYQCKGCLDGRELNYTFPHGESLQASSGDRLESICGHYSFTFFMLSTIF